MQYRNKLKPENTIWVYEYFPIAVLKKLQLLLQTALITFVSFKDHKKNLNLNFTSKEELCINLLTKKVVLLVTALTRKPLRL